MADPRTLQSLDRIDAALARIETAIASRKPARDAALAARHERLRRATAAAIAELDSVIRIQEPA